MKTTLTLYELNALVRETIETTLPRQYWVEAELMEAREVRGHCYMELGQKDERGNTPIARAQAKCWHNTWALVKPHFERVAGQPLRAGLKVLLKVYAQFHEAYGFSWIVTDIDPTFTLGDMARRRQEIIRQLQDEGVLNLNKELPLPLFAQRIAVVSSAQAAGYGDFVHQLEANPLGLRFRVKLFPAIMQGEQVEQSIVAALDAINDERENFDCVVIIRGGGAVADMSGFDTLRLAENVANFPLPVITGIGHDRDECVLDIVSHTRVKTPTAAADLLVANLSRTAQRVSDARQQLLHHTSRRMDLERLRLARVRERIPALVSALRPRHQRRLSQLQTALVAAVERGQTRRHHRIDLLRTTIPALAERTMLRHQHRLQLLRQQVRTADPAILLQRGYSITLRNGRAVRHADDLKEGDIIETRLAEGRITSVVKQ